MCLKNEDVFRRAARPVIEWKIRETPRGEVPPHVLRYFGEKLRKQREHARIYGEGCTPVTTARGEEKFVAIAGKLFNSNQWKTFHDFLIFYAFDLFGRDWMKSESHKPPTERHPMAQWLLDVQAFQQKNHQQNQIVQTAPATAAVWAYMRTAYDLFVLEQNRLLQKKLMIRLKNNRQFQGARYETYVAASFVKAGFEIVLEDESDTSTSHCEFNATHNATKSKYSIEAKSRHRKGYLGQPGDRKPLAGIKAQVSELLKKALSKRADYERIVFIDINVPPEHDRIFETEWFKRVFEDVNQLLFTQRKGTQYPPAFLIFTNQAEHYVEGDQPAPRNSVLFSSINIPDFQLHDPSVKNRYPAVMALMNSLNKHTHIPRDF